MMPLLARGVVEVTGNGETVTVDPLGPIFMGVLLVFLVLLPFLLVLLLGFYRSKHRHLQIMAAMEKGLPITDLIAMPHIRNREVNWVRSLSAGIGFLFVGLALAGYFVWTNAAPGVTSVEPTFLILPIVIFGLGLIFLFRGILQRNYEKQKGNTPPSQ